MIKWNEGDRQNAEMTKNESKMWDKNSKPNTINACNQYKCKANKQLNFWYEAKREEEKRWKYVQTTTTITRILLLKINNNRSKRKMNACLWNLISNLFDFLFFFLVSFSVFFGQMSFAKWILLGNALTNRIFPFW